MLSTKNLLVQVLVMPNRQNKRNISLISDEELEKRKGSQIPLNTKHNTAWAVRAWKEWVDEGNNKAPVKYDKVREGFNIKQGRAGQMN